ncbi:hypothetical protein ACFV5G_17370 [Streptomyces sp. NPDC059766]|uniref:hypothetical protein n=1 Tax=Streptomyces sp. NPDC059766 TaxID=3346940 RepID=UPI00364CCB75
MSVGIVLSAAALTLLLVEHRPDQLDRYACEKSARAPVPMTLGMSRQQADAGRAEKA